MNDTTADLRARPARVKLERALSRIAAQEAAYKATTVGRLCAERARTHASHIAIDVFDRGERATYAEVDAESNRIAHALNSFGVRKGDRVAVMLPNRLVFPLLWFALAKLGAVIVPVNMRYTPREIAYVVSDAGVTLAIVDGSAAHLVQAMDPWPLSLPHERVLVVDGEPFGRSTSFESLVASFAASPLDEDVGPDDLMNIQYTSGTTGFPKGCVLTHDYWSVFSYQAACWDKQPYRRYLSAQPFFYADPQWHLLKSYRQGGTLFLAPQLSATRFIGWVKAHAIEWCQFPELAARQPERPDDASTSLRQITHFGWSSETARAFRRRFKAPGQDAFAMTEIGFGTQMPHDIEEMYDSMSVGIRAPFRQVRLVNEDGSPTAPGEVGEMWVKGRSIFRGYWAKPEANAEAFVGEWFRTGDLFRVDEAGFFWLVGRVKEMIRRSGENIAAREVEAVIRGIPEIADVAAVPVRDPIRGEEVKVYIELRSGVSRDDVPVDRILEHARAHLAVFKVPRYISYIEALPRTVTNKVLKRELTGRTDPLRDCYDAHEGVWR